MEPNSDAILRLERHCPRLGGLVAFSYCRMAADNQNPCFKIFDCWWDRFDVVGYLEQRLSKANFEHLRNFQPPDKTATLVDLIRKARQQNAKSLCHPFSDSAPGSTDTRTKK